VYRQDNALLPRADIHTLLDLQLLAFEPATRQVVLSRLIRGIEYESLSGARLAEPVVEGMCVRDYCLIYFGRPSAKQNPQGSARPVGGSARSPTRSVYVPIGVSYAECGSRYPVSVWSRPAASATASP
jgi:hypothetical protein